MLIAAPLFVLSRPLAATVWAAPAAWRASLGALGQAPVVAAMWRWVTEPLTATFLHGLALWLWHAPPLFDAALSSEPLHRLQHASFFVTALWFWHAMLCGRTRASATGVALFCLFATALHTGFLGILVTFAREPLYAYDVAALAAWGWTAIEDQQLAGLIMWVPGGVLYTVAALALMGLWLGKAGAEAYEGDRPRFPQERLPSQSFIPEAPRSGAVRDP
jgi:cytochrome c oxidase assembly factor CtaG